MRISKILEKYASRRVLVVGDVMVDHYLWGEVNRISPEAPVPVVHVAKETRTAGGAANVALNLASLGVKTELIGCLGADNSALELRALLAKKSIGCEHCVTLLNVPTIVKTRVVARTQQLCRIDYESPRGAYDLNADPIFHRKLEAVVATVDAIVVSDYAKGVVTQPLLDAVIAMAGQHGKLVAIDPKPSRRLNLSGASVLTPNRSEALELAGFHTGGGDMPSLAEIAFRIHQAYAPKLLVITLGADGMAICRQGKVEHVMPTQAREVFDVSGAGDTVISTLTAALACGADPVSAAHIANIAAGIVVSKFGTATVTPPEILERLKELPVEEPQ